MKSALSAVVPLCASGFGAPGLPRTETTVAVRSQPMPAATRAAIHEALRVVAALCGTVEFPDPVYDVDSSLHGHTLAGRMRLRGTHPGQSPTIRYVGTSRQRFLLGILSESHSVAVEGLAFDGDLRVAQLVRVQRDGVRGEHFLGSVLIRDSAFRRGRQRVHRTGRIVEGLDEAWGHEDAAAAGVANAVTVSGNRLTSCSDDLVRVGDPRPGAVIGGDVFANRVVFAVKQSPQFFRPRLWAGNERILYEP